MPFTTRVPQNGGVGTGLSTATSERAGMSSGREVGTAPVVRADAPLPQGGSSAPGTRA